VRLAGFFLCSLIATVIAASLNGLKIDSAPFRCWYYRVLARIVGLRVVARGIQSTAKPHLVVANHISYYDIVALGSLVAGDFVAKADIAKWLKPDAACSSSAGAARPTTRATKFKSAWTTETR
jgi:1-acyl-sn-glycerol-3-phosphate acyltransferase